MMKILYTHDKVNVHQALLFLMEVESHQASVAMIKLMFTMLT